MGMIEVIKPGFYTSVQDMGRVGARAFGVPISGVMDAYSARIANAVLGNKPQDAVLEIALGGVELLFLNQTIICLTGADFSATLNGVPVRMNSPVHVRQGERLRLQFPRQAALGYCAVAGGIQTEMVLNSRSMQRGVTKEVQLKTGMLLPITSLSGQSLVLGRLPAVDPMHFTTISLRAYAGPEFKMLQPEEESALLSGSFHLSRDCSRVGFRLAETIPYEAPKPMLTSAVMPGTVQLTPSGSLIVLMRDCQVTGGYPRVLQCTEESCNRLAQKRPGDVVKFELLELEKWPEMY